MTRAYDLLVFDWDGTLADSAALIVSGMQAAIARLELPPRTDAQIRELIGLGFDDAVQRLFPDLEMASLRPRLEAYRRHLVAGGQPNGPAEAPLFAGALAAMQYLHREGYRIAVATGKSRSSLERSLARHPEVRALLSSSRCADESAHKPDPRMLHELLECEDVSPGRALMIGDTEYDMAMARGAGLPAVGVACGVHDGARLLAAGAVALIEHVHHLPAWLGLTGWETPPGPATAAPR